MRHPPLARLGSLAVVILCSFALVAASCGTKNPGYNQLVTSGQAITTLGNVFADAVGVYNTLLDQKLISQSDYDAFKKFGVIFQDKYPKLTATWRSARATFERVAKEQMDKGVERSVALQEAAKRSGIDAVATSLRELSTELMTFYTAGVKKLADAGWPTLPPDAVTLAGLLAVVPWRRRRYPRDILEEMRTLGLVRPISGGAVAPIIALLPTLLPLLMQAIEATPRIVASVRDMINVWKEDPLTLEAMQAHLAELDAAMSAAEERVRNAPLR